MLSVVGLSLDLIGAVALTIGLFRGPLPTVYGYARSTEEAAADRAYGIVGGSFLTFGFTLQALGYFGVDVDASSTENILAAVVAICVGKLLALVLYGVAYTRQLPRLDDQARKRWPEIPLGRPRRAPRGLIFWHHERDSEQPPEA